MSNPAATHCLWTSSTSSTQTDIHAPLSAVSSPSDPNVEVFVPLPQLPWPPRQRKISHSPEPTAPKVGGFPQSQHFLHPHFSNQVKLAMMSDTFNIGVMAFAFMLRKGSTASGLDKREVMGVSNRSASGHATSQSLLHRESEESRAMAVLGNELRDGAIFDGVGPQCKRGLL
jgi:hypothetical protein